MWRLLHFCFLACMVTVLLSRPASLPDKTDEKGTTTSPPVVNSAESRKTTQKSPVQDQDSHSGFKITIEKFNNPPYINGLYDCTWSSSTNNYKCGLRKKIVKNNNCQKSSILVEDLLGEKDIPLPNLHSQHLRRNCNFDRKFCSGWIHRDNSSYYVWQYPVEWQEAVDLCKTINSTLFVPNTVEEMNAVFKDMSPELYWIGLQRENEQKKAHWNVENGIDLSKLVLMNGTSFVTEEYLESYGEAIKPEKMCGAVVPFVDEEYKLRTLMYPCSDRNDFVCKGNTREPVDKCQDNFIYNNRTCYHVSDHLFVGTNWQDAKEYCQGRNSTLFVPSTIEEMNSVFKQVPPETYWIGLQRESEQEKAHWTGENGIDLSKLSLILGSSTSIYTYAYGIWKKGVTEKTCEAVYPSVINKELRLRTFMYQCNSRFHFVCKGNTRQSADECSFGSIYHNETCYYADQEQLPVKWEEAVKKCQYRNSTLFVPSSKEEMISVFKQLSFQTYWIGIKQKHADWNKEIGIDSPELINEYKELFLIDRYMETDGKIMGSEKMCGAAMAESFSRPSTLMYPCNNLNYFVCKTTRDSMKNLLERSSVSEFFIDLHT